MGRPSTLSPRSAGRSSSPAGKLSAPCATGATELA
jgi:hypothetical protein